jgi:hypothetical protein
LLRVKKLLRSRSEHELCRIAGKIFLRGKVFNTSVDKFVEKAARLDANCTVLSILTLFAQFRCRIFLLALFPQHSLVERLAEITRRWELFWAALPCNSLSLKLLGSLKDTCDCLSRLNTTSAVFPDAP